MSYDVHINVVGDTPDPVFGMLRTDRSIDKIYLLCDDDELHVKALDRIISGLEGVGITDVINITVDPTDYAGTFQTLSSILDRERNSHPDLRIHANFSTGDPVTVIALRHAMDSFDNDMYYLRGGKAVSMGQDSVDDIATLKVQTKVLDTFIRFKESERISNKELMGDLSSPALSYRTKELDRMGLIRKEGSSKNPMWVITPKGQQMLKRF